MNYLEILFGKRSFQEWIAFISLFLLGVLLQYLIKINNRKFKKTIKFNWNFFWEDNKIKFFLILILMWMSIRFYVDVSNQIESFLPFKAKVTESFLLFLAGFLNQVIINFLSKKLGYKKDITKFN